LARASAEWEGSPRDAGSLDRHPVEVAEDAPCLDSLQAPGVEPLEPGPAPVLHALAQRQRLRRDDEHLDVGELVRRPARDAAGQHDLLDDWRKCAGDSLREPLQFT
jgi:hypothetical protein